LSSGETEIVRVRTYFIKPNISIALDIEWADIDIIIEPEHNI
jgi:hypothetical protein